MKNYFIDKLNIVQTHQNRLPFIGSYMQCRVDLKTGESSEWVSPQLQLEGSYSSLLTIRSNGHRVEVYGNPSRWGRIDNLFGLKTLEDCISVYNHVLRKLGLPEFTKSTKYLYLSSKTGKPVISADGAIIQHIDYTRNHYVGKGNQQSYIKGLASHSIGRSISPHLFADENTVEWFGNNVQKNGSEYRYIKVYNKVSDLLRQQSKHCFGASFEDREYYDKLIQFCYELGVIREEHSFKAKWLKKNKCFAWGLFKESFFEQHLQDITNIRRRLEVSKMEYETIADRLLAEEIVKTRQAANATQNAYLMWMHGMSFNKSGGQYRLYKSRLLQLGIDISIKLDITRTPLYLKNHELIEVRDLNVPDWYKLPVVPDNKLQLRLVA